MTSASTASTSAANPIRAWLVPALLLAVAGTATAQDTQKKLYCWNEGARKICGDALPPEAVNRARTEINPDSGMRSRQVGRVLTPAERAIADVQAKREAELARAEAARKRRDMAMAESYSTEADLRRAFGERISLVDEGLKTSRLGVINLRHSLTSLLRQAGELELQGKPVARPLAENIQDQHADLRQQLSILAQQLDERQSLDQDLAKALARYRQMKQPQSSAATSDG